MENNKNKDNLLQILIIVPSVIGSYLNSPKLIEGFYFWLIANILLLILSIRNKNYWLVILYLYYIITCIMGLVIWR